MTRVARALFALVAAAAAAAVVATGPLSTAPAAAMPTGTVVYLVGDSITDGRYWPDWWRDSYAIRARDRICGMYCAAQLVTVAHGGGCLVATGCGYPIPATQWMYTEVLDATPRPTTVVLQLGLNDLLHASDQQIWGAYAELYFAARDRGIRLIVATITPVCFTFGGWPEVNAQLQRVNTWIRNLSGLPWIADVNAVLRAGNGSMQPQYALGGCAPGSDPIHPNALGALRMADMLPLDQIR